MKRKIQQDVKTYSYVNQYYNVYKDVHVLLIAVQRPAAWQDHPSDRRPEMICQVWLH